MKKYGTIIQIIELSKAEKQDLLRVVLPGEEYAIVIHETEEEDLEDIGERWELAFNGDLPVESFSAVLGGALAVP